MALTSGTDYNQDILKQFTLRGLDKPGEQRLTGLSQDVAGGRKITGGPKSIAAGLDSYMKAEGMPNPTLGAPAADSVDFSSELEALTEDQIAAAMDEIETRYGLTRAELEADQGAAGRAFRQLEAQLKRHRDQALESAESGAIQRGIFHSGIYGEDVAEVQRGFAEGTSQAQAERQAKLSAIQNALSQLDAQKSAEQASVAAQLRRDQLMAAAQQYGA